MTKKDNIQNINIIQDTEIFNKYHGMLIWSWLSRFISSCHIQVYKIMTNLLHVFLCSNITLLCSVVSKPDPNLGHCRYLTGSAADLVLVGTDLTLTIPNTTLVSFGLDMNCSRHVLLVQWCSHRSEWFWERNGAMAMWYSGTGVERILKTISIHDRGTFNAETFQCERSNYFTEISISIT